VEEGTLIGSFDKNQREEIRVRLTEYGGHRLIDIRAYWEDKDGEKKPGKGLAIRRELLPELKKLIDAAVKAEKEASRES
jgi:hypothetical protein